MSKLFRDLKPGDDFWRVSINKFGKVGMSKMHITEIVKDEGYTMFRCHVYQFPDLKLIGTGYIYPILDCSVDAQTYPGWIVCAEREDASKLLKEFIETLPKSILLSIEYLNRLESL